MSELIDALERILAWRREHKPEDVDRFKPGLSLEELREKLSQFPRKLPQELYTLYQWHNGTNDDSWECAVFVFHSFLDIDSALQHAEHGVNADFQRDNREIEDQPLYLFPFCDLDGEYFAVLGVDKETDSTPVVIVDDIGGSKIVFNSLTAMMLALAECYETGVYDVIDNGLVDVVDPVEFRRIRLKYNPGAAENIYADGW